MVLGSGWSFPWRRTGKNLLGYSLKKTSLQCFATATGNSQIMRKQRKPDSSLHSTMIVNKRKNKIQIDTDENLQRT